MASADTGVIGGGGVEGVREGGRMSCLFCLEVHIFGERIRWIV